MHLVNIGDPPDKFMVLYVPNKSIEIASPSINQDLVTS